MTDVAAFHKAPPAECACGCGEVGQLRRRPGRNGVQCVKACKGCAACRGRASAKVGRVRQVRALGGIGIDRSVLHPGNEELLGGAVRCEVKAGGQILPAWTAYLRMEGQSEAARPIGDHRPFVALIEPPDVDDGLICFRRSQGPEAIAALAEQYGMLS